VTSPRLRIGIDAYPLTTWGGGIQRYTEGLLRGLARIGANHEFAVYRGEEHAPRARPLEGCARIRWVPPRSSPMRLLDHLSLPGLQRGPARQVDLYHGTNYFVPLYCPVPSVITVHDLSVQLHPEQHPLLRRIQHLTLPGICRRSRLIITDSSHTRDDLVRVLRVPKEKIRVIPLAVADEFRPIDDRRALTALRKRYRLPERYLLYVGALEPRKNLPTLLGALALQGRSASRIPLVIAGVGRPEYERELRDRAKAEGLALGEDLYFAGFVADEDLPTLYSHCEALLYPSSYEGFGLPPLEAMACGAPVVVADNSSLRELYGDCALVAEGSSASALQAAIAGLLDDPASRERLALLGVQRARARSWDDVAAETLDVYREALDAAL
jgi:glycosyltransferase involved in cell wall biosynthesis